MKKILFLALACAMVVGMAACGNSAGNKPQVVSHSSMAVTEVEDTFEGLCKYLEGNGIIAGTPIEKNAEIIGANAGRGYSVEYDGGQVRVELYEYDFEKLEKMAQEKNYDLQKLTDLATRNLESVRKDGTLQAGNVLQGQSQDNFPLKDVQAMISNNGKYLMIYSDEKSDESHIAQRQRAETLFKEFKQ